MYILFSVLSYRVHGHGWKYEKNLCAKKKEKREKVISKHARLVCICEAPDGRRRDKTRRRSEKRKIINVTTKQHNSESNTSLFCQDYPFKIIYCVIFNKTNKKQKKAKLLPFFFLFFFFTIYASLFEY